MHKKKRYISISFLAPLVGLEPTTYRLTAERSTNWAKEEYNKLATTYLPSKVTRKYFRHPKAWLLCSVWVQVFPFGSSHQKFFVHFLVHSKIHRQISSSKVNLSWLSPRSISTGQLHALLHFHLQPINQVVFLESYYFNSMGYLILRWASHLDAFSVYPFHT